MPILLGLGVTLGLLALYINSRPSAFRYERSLTSDAPAAALHGLIDDFHNWAQWSPWDKADPTVQKTYDGPAAGVGAKYHWLGKKTGEGRMTILASEPARIDIDLVFIKPFAAHNKAIFTLEPEGANTKVTWVMEGESNFLSKAFGVFMNMEKMLGKDFDSGLAAMRDAAKKG